MILDVVVVGGCGGCRAVVVVGGGGGVDVVERYNPAGTKQIRKHCLRLAVSRA